MFQRLRNLVGLNSKDNATPATSNMSFTTLTSDNVAAASSEQRAPANALPSQPAAASSSSHASASSSSAHLSAPPAKSSASSAPLLEWPYKVSSSTSQSADMFQQSNPPSYESFPESSSYSEPPLEQKKMVKIKLIKKDKVIKNSLPPADDEFKTEVMQIYQSSVDDEFTNYIFPTLEEVLDAIQFSHDGAKLINLNAHDINILFTKIYPQELIEYANDKEELKHRYYLRAKLAMDIYQSADAFEKFRLHRFYNLDYEYIINCFKESARLGNISAGLILADAYWLIRGKNESAAEVAAKYYIQILERFTSLYQKFMGTDSSITPSPCQLVDILGGIQHFISLAKEFRAHTIKFPKDLTVNQCYLAMMEACLDLPSEDLTVRHHLDLANLIHTMPHSEAKNIWNKMTHIHLALHHATQGFYQAHNENNKHWVSALCTSIEENLLEYIKQIQSEDGLPQLEPEQASSLKPNNPKIQNIYYITMLELIARFKNEKKKVKELCEVSAMLPGMIDFALSVCTNSRRLSSPDSDRIPYQSFQKENANIQLSAKLFLEAVITPSWRLPLHVSERNKLDLIMKSVGKELIGLWDNVTYINFPAHLIPLISSILNFYKDKASMSACPTIRDTFETAITSYIDLTIAENKSLKKITLVTDFYDKDPKDTELHHSYYIHLLQIFSGLKELESKKINEFLEISAILPGMIDYSLALLAKGEDEVDEVDDTDNARPDINKTNLALFAQSFLTALAGFRPVPARMMLINEVKEKLPAFYRQFTSSSHSEASASSSMHVSRNEEFSDRSTYSPAFYSTPRRGTSAGAGAGAGAAATPTSPQVDRSSMLP